MELGEPGSSKPWEFMDVFQCENGDMTLTLLEKILFLKAKVNVNKSEFREMVSGVMKSPF